MSESPQVNERGVYVIPGIGSRGEHSIVVVDSLGARRVTLTAEFEQDIQPLINALWRALDQIDPPRSGAVAARPRLRLLHD